MVGNMSKPVCLFCKRKIVKVDFEKNFSTNWKKITPNKVRQIIWFDEKNVKSHFLSIQWKYGLLTLAQCVIIRTNIQSDCLSQWFLEINFVNCNSIQYVICHLISRNMFQVLSNHSVENLTLFWKYFVKPTFLKKNH